MNEIVKVGPEPLRNSMIAVVARAASDPAVNIDKMTALLEMQEKLEAREAKRDFDLAMEELNRRCDLRVGKAGVANMGGKGSYKYARYEDMMAVVFPVMRELGLRFSFPYTTSTTSVTVYGALIHSGGHAEKTEITLPFDFGPGRNALQAVGSALAYAKRYCAEGLLNVVREDEDDDGQAGGQRRPPPPRHEHEVHPLDEPNGTIWLKNLRAALDAATTIDTIAVLRGHKSVGVALEKAPAAIKSIIDDEFRKASARLAPQPETSDTWDAATASEQADAEWSSESAEDADAFVERVGATLPGLITAKDVTEWSRDPDVRKAMDNLRTAAPKTFAKVIGLIDARIIELQSEGSKG